MKIVQFDGKFKVKQTEKHILILLSRNKRPTPDFVKLLGIKFQELIEGEIRKNV